MQSLKLHCFRLRSPVLMESSIESCIMLYVCTFASCMFVCTCCCLSGMYAPARYTSPREEHGNSPGWSMQVMPRNGKSFPTTFFLSAQIFPRVLHAYIYVSHVYVYVSHVYIYVAYTYIRSRTHM